MIEVRKFGFLILILVSICIGNWEAKAQNVPIFLDGQFDDWFNITTQYEDKQGDANGAFGVDLFNFSVTNSQDYLFIRLNLSQNIKLVEDNDLFLYIDTDFNAQTGKSINEIGAEIGIDFGNRLVYMYPNNSLFTYNLDRIGYRSLPTTSGFEHEIALHRDALMPDNITPVFSNSSIQILFKDESTFNGDSMPDNGTTFTYTFEENPVEANSNINIEKDEAHYLRVMTYNTLHNGLTDGSRANAFRRILQAVQPDIITFNECWDVSATYTQNFMNNTLPLSNDAEWHSIKLDDGNITVSRYPILQSKEVSPGRRITASLIDLPDNQYEKDFLVINAHFKCCGDGDSQRQIESDAFAAFIKDIKNSEASIEVAEDTPFVLSGDLNLVGSSRQLTTLLKGDIVNEFIYGEDMPLDWDGTDLEDVISPQTGDYAAFTWLGEGSSFPPGRLDFMIHSNSVMEVKKAYTLNTKTTPLQDLDYYALNANDTEIASDHLPKITDFELTATTNIPATTALSLQLKLQPNPFEANLQISYQLQQTQALQWQLFNSLGQIVWQTDTHNSSGKMNVSMEIEVAGVYLLKVKDEKSQNYRVWRLIRL